MLSTELDDLIEVHADFPKKGILFRDVLPVLQKPNVFKELINIMSSDEIFGKAEAIIAVDARGFLFASSIGIKLSKPVIVARKPGKLPGQLITKSYDLEYGKNSLSIQKELISKYQSFVIVDDLLATGGTLECIYNIVSSMKKIISGVSVIIELKELQGRERLPFKVISQITY